MHARHSCGGLVISNITTCKQNLGGMPKWSYYIEWTPCRVLILWYLNEGVSWTAELVFPPPSIKEEHKEQSRAPNTMESEGLRWQDLFFSYIVIWEYSKLLLCWLENKDNVIVMKFYFNTPPKRGRQRWRKSDYWNAGMLIMIMSSLIVWWNII